MYHPYFRGKQYELITIRESAGVMSESGFTPIIEPVKQSLGSLHKTLSHLRDTNVSAIVIVNPTHGEHASGGDDISALLAGEFAEYQNLRAGILLKERNAIEEILAIRDAHADHPISLIHSGFANGRDLAEALGDQVATMQHVFLEEQCGKLYRRHFQSENRVLIRDGFQRRRNKDHPEVEFFSDLHVTFNDEGVSGFGDFLIVGDEYSDSGGPAYAVAIHLTFVDHDRDDEMHIYHFKSDRSDTPTDPAGKFAEALTKLIDKLDTGESKLVETTAIAEFRDLHRRGHFPGLGYVKKLSMKHHIETLADYFM